MTPHDEPNDDWIDAFTPADLVDPELARVDAAVSRLVGARTPSRWGSWLVVGLLALAAAVVALVHPGTAPPAPDPAPPTPVVADAPGTSAPIPQLVVRRAVAPPVPVTLPGLDPAPDAVVVVANGRATVRSGFLRYLHDETHEPGVREVAFANLPLVIRPVGTAFTVDGRGGVGAVRVEAGRIRLVHDDGTVLAELGPGEEALTVVDLDSASGVRVVATSGLALDGIEARLPKACACRPRDAVAAVALVRLSTSAH